VKAEKLTLDLRHWFLNPAKGRGLAFSGISLKAEGKK
jgi:hypothetical protein